MTINQRKLIIDIPVYMINSSIPVTAYSMLFVQVPVMFTTHGDPVHGSLAKWCLYLRSVNTIHHTAHHTTLFVLSLHE